MLHNAYPLLGIKRGSKTVSRWWLLKQAYMCHFWLFSQLVHLRVPFPQIRLLNWRVKIPFYLCKTRNLTEAMQALFTVYPHNHVPARHLTPQQFEIYLKIFRTGFAPSGRSLEDSARWTFVGKCALHNLPLTASRAGEEGGSGIWENCFLSE